MLSVILWKKTLLQSSNCRETIFRSHIAGTWEDFGAVVSSAGLDQDTTSTWFKPTVDLALFDPVPGSTIEIGHIRMLDPQGRNILFNGDFSRGTERWYFTDGQHPIWRIENQYVMSLFESGALGLASLILLAGTALAGALRAMGRGDCMAAAVAASLAGFLCSGVFDYILGAPRISALFYIIAFSGLTMTQTQMRKPVSGIIPDRSGSR